MGRHSCCNQQKVKRGLWSPEEDDKLIQYITTHGYGCWSEVPEKAGLQRCGKSCRLRWINYLRPNIRRGRFTLEEEKLIITLHSLVGNRWAHIASHLPGRTDNEIKNYWNSWIRKKIRKPSSITNPPQSVDHHHPLQLNYNLNKVDHFANQDNTIAKPPLQDTLFSPTCPIFMFDTTSTEVITNASAVLFQDTFDLSPETSNLSNHQVEAITPHLPTTTFTAAEVIDPTNYYLPPLIENVENVVPIESCNVKDEGEVITLESMQRQELNSDWVETQQQCPSFLFWDNSNFDVQLGGGELAPNSSNMGTNTLSPFPFSTL